MSCGVALAVSLLMIDPSVAPLPSLAPAAPVAEAPPSVASEPLFAEIVTRSTAMRGIVGTWISAGAADNADFGSSPEFALLARGATTLADLDMKGHLTLKDRGVDGDLKCILRGISEDMPVKLEAVRAAAAPADRRLALDELFHLFEDNAAVITSPPAPAA